LEQLEDRIMPTGPTLTAVASFNGTNGASPYAGLIMDGSGNLFGTTTAGGASHDGTVFELAKGSGTIHTLVSFNGSNGAGPYAGLILDGSGNLYGTTTAGGAVGDGTVFELANGSNTIQTLASFNGTTGQQPYGGVILDGSGNLYGTTWQGGTFNYGTIFELAKGSSTVATLASFNGNNGLHPDSSLIMDGSGNLYGTAQGGIYGYGTVFELAKGSGTITTLASFNGTNGATPKGSLIMDGSGNLYGTTAGGGGNYGGEVFELAKGSSNITLLASFHGAPSTDGSSPEGGVTMDSSGNLYGTTQVGGASGEGTIFELAKGSGAITWLASFNNTTGAFPTDGLLMDGRGNLYGTASGRGASGGGTVFELQGAIPDAAVFVGQSVPSQMVAGHSYQVSVTMRNTGSGTWTASQLYRLGSQNPQDNTLWGTGRVGLPGPVAPGQQVTFNFTVTAPAKVGSYNFQWRVVQDGVEWFGGYTPDVPVAVVAGPASHFSVTSSQAATLVGTALTFTVTALDAAGNVAIGYTGTIHCTSSGAAAIVPPPYTFTPADKGQHTFTITPQAAGTLTIQFADQANPTIGGSATVTVMAVPTIVPNLVGLTMSFGTPSVYTNNLAISSAQDQNGATGTFVAAFTDSRDGVVTTVDGTITFKGLAPNPFGLPGYYYDFAVTFSGTKISNFHVNPRTGNWSDDESNADGSGDFYTNAVSANASIYQQGGVGALPPGSWVYSGNESDSLTYDSSNGSYVLGSEGGPVKAYNWYPW
jgi:uncharacterized repeat protein (TIGR03803 family)